MKKNLMPTIGTLTGFVLIMWAITASGDIVNFIDGPSVIITLLGSFCALMISFPFKVLKNIPNTMRILLLSPKDNRGRLVSLFTELSKKARMNGLLALEDDLHTMDDELLITGLQMVVDGVEPDVIKDVLELRLATTERRHRIGQEVFEKWGELAPGFGMLGTLIGLIIMLSKMEDANSIGSGMATALVTTFYGSLFANLVFLPTASNLSAQTDEEIFTGEMIIEGILEIQAGSNPRLLEEKLLTYLSPQEKAEYLSGGYKVKEERAYE
ncbi:MAG: motility protein A [Tissierellaceae bacterium]|jgi:chemotaxis protein MotA